MSVEEILSAVDELPEDERRRVYLELARRQQEDTSTAYDKAKHILGRRPGSGLRDVSSNKDYLRGLGERSLP